MRAQNLVAKTDEKNFNAPISETDIVGRLFWGADIVRETASITRLPKLAPLKLREPPLRLRICA